MDITFNCFVDSDCNIVYYDYGSDGTFTSQPNSKCIENIKTPEGVATLIDIPDYVLFDQKIPIMELVCFNPSNGINSNPVNTHYSIVLTEKESGHVRKQLVGADSLDCALNWCQELGSIGKVFILGTSDTFLRLVASKKLTHIHIMKTPDNVKGSEKFPIQNIALIPHNSTQFNGNVLFDLRNVEEIRYQMLLRRLLGAPSKPNRTNIDTKVLFHEVLKFKLHNNCGNILPLLTTKRMPWKSILHELIWFLRGSTNTDYLVQHNIHIWDGNSSREYLDKYNLSHYREGELGPIYGHQWRSFGKPYNETNADQCNENGSLSYPDQISQIIQTLKKDPFNRRLVVCAWNPLQASEMALVPCHYSFQFVVEPDTEGRPKYLDCLVNMRSADVFLGVPFNIASYAFLTHIIAYLTGLIPNILSISMADCHLYANHISQVKLLLSRVPRSFPTIQFGPAIVNTPDVNIDHFTNVFTPEDYIISDYNPHPSIKASMAV